MESDEDLPTDKETYHQKKLEYEKTMKSCPDEHWEQKIIPNQKDTEKDTKTLNKTTTINGGLLHQPFLTILSTVCILSHSYQNMKKFFIHIRIMQREDVKYESQNKRKKKDNRFKKKNLQCRRISIVEDAHRPRYKSSRHHITTYDKKAIGFLLFIVIPCPSYCKINVTLVNEFVIFGNDVILMCACNASMTNVNTWTKGPTNMQLTLGASSNDIEKYIPYLKKNDDLHSYFLTIRNFEINDLDKYNCQFDFEGSSYTLSLDKRFVYRPKVDEIISNVSHESGFVNLTILMQTVYPDPICEMALQGYNLTNKEPTILEKSSRLYTAFFTILLFPADKINCTVVATLNCTLSAIPLFYKRNFTICQEKDNRSSRDRNDKENLTVIVPVIIVYYIGGAVLFIAAFYSWKRRYKLTRMCFQYTQVDNESED